MTPHILIPWYPLDSSSSSLISSSLHSHVTLKPEWCDKIKLSNLLLPRKGGTIKSLQLLSTSTGSALRDHKRSAFVRCNPNPQTPKPKTSSRYRALLADVGIEARPLRLTPLSLLSAAREERDTPDHRVVGRSLPWQQ